jgi:hypothetical protein
MATNVARSDYVNAIIEAFAKDVTKTPLLDDWLWNGIPFETVNQTGEDKLNFTFQTQGNESAYLTAEGAANGSANVPAYAKGYTYLKKIGAPMRFTEETVFLSKDPNTIVKTLETYTSDTIAAYNMMREFMIHQPGTGVLATVGTVHSTTDTTSVFHVDSARWLRVGMIVDAYTGASENIDSITITDVDYDDNLVTGTHTSDTIVAADVLYPHNAYVSSSTIITSYFWNGIETLIGDTDTAFGTPLTTGLDRDTQSFAKACVKYGTSAGTAEALTLGRMRAVCDSIDVNWGRSMPTIIYTDPGSLNAYNELLTNKQAPTINMPTEDGWPEAVAFVWNGKKMRVVSKRLAAPETMFFLNPSTLKKYIGGETGWDTMAGTFQKVSGYQIFERMYRGWGNLICTNFRANGRLNDITAVV